MGCDIHGYVEAKSHLGYWDAIIDAGNVLWRAYDLFGCLFAVRNYANFKPIAEDRGIPDNASWDTKSRHGEEGYDAHSASFITLDEIHNICWEELAVKEDDRQHIVDEDGVTMSKFLDTNRPVKTVRKVLQRKDAKTDDFERLVRYMEMLREDYEDVRLVVWFDN